MNRQASDLLDPRTEQHHPFTTPPQPHRAAAPPPPPPTAGERHVLRVLVVENETRAADALVQGLLRQGYRAESVATGGKALQLHHQADLILLDLDLPDLDGLEVCRSVRSVSDTPIIAVTGRGSELDRVLGLQAGADDYMVKPYGFRELLARIEAVMRRARPRQAITRIIDHGPLRIDATTREATLDGRQVDLTRKEFDLLHLLASQPGAVISRRQLMTQVWDDTWSHRGRTIDTHVSSLRGKLGSSNWIITVRGVGFRLGHP
ncbi:response regulator transcription factor [Streptomyces sp. ISL-36]|uniref:response regulator transcription factor n=1 Tax=Streptomyces sp. ISL-36 TaxID=2819182 RepID=UPI001BE95CF1|nr:response regulator transcription factor [Streptomyces sp. ISL-36]MBT2443402.1 response regulator transcription factor [Streptomyces sp. ISL-36]